MNGIIQLKRKWAIIITQLSEAKAILRNYHALKERRYVGDTDASDTLVDFEIAVTRASLTARQAEALRLVYIEDLTQKVAGERMGLAQDAVSHLVDRAEIAIQAIYDRWKKKEEESA